MRRKSGCGRKLVSRKLPMSDGYNALKGREREFCVFSMSASDSSHVEYCSRGYVKRAEECERLAGACIADARARNTSIHCRTSGEGWPKTLQLDPADQRRQKVTSHRTPNATQQMSSAVRRYARSHAYFADPACGVRTPAGQARCEVACADGPPYLL